MSGAKENPERVKGTETLRYRYSEGELADISRQIDALRRRPGLETLYVSFLNDDAHHAGADNAFRCIELVHGLAGEPVPKAPKAPKRTMKDFFKPKSK